VQIDRDLVDRLESTGAQLNALAADALVAAGAPGASRARPWGAGLLVAFGSGRYVNRLCGLGTAEVDVTAGEQIEDFFLDHGVRPTIDVTPWASASLRELLRTRCYTPSAFRNVYVRFASPFGDHRSDAPVIIEPVTSVNLEQWLSVIGEATGALGDSMRASSDEYCRARFAMPAGHNFLARIDGVPVGCGSVETEGGIAWLGGMATLPAYRGRGVQSALIRHRVDFAASEGVQLVASSAVPDGASARNLLRHDFRLAYSRVEVMR
jgi:GNAT superfamily N-acetyltransferase